MVGETEKSFKNSNFPSSAILRAFASPMYANGLCSAFQLFCDNNSQIPLFQYSEENSSSNYPADGGSEYDMIDTLQAVVNPHLCKHCKSCEPFPAIEQDNLPENRSASAERWLSQPSKGDKNIEERQCHNSNKSPDLSTSSHQEQHSPESSGIVFVTSGVNKSGFSGETNPWRKKRIKWTEELHKKFIYCVDSLGGAKKATPKAILKLMNSKELTIYHVKSHLQKYRAVNNMPEYVQGSSDTIHALDLGDPEKTTSKNDVLELCMRSNMQMKEALQLQLDCEKNLREQLEIQQKLRPMIEEQLKQIKMLIEQKEQNDLHKIMKSISSSQG